MEGGSDEDDPFSCFGSVSSSSSSINSNSNISGDDSSDEEQNSGDAANRITSKSNSPSATARTTTPMDHNAACLERGQRLLNENDLRKKNSLLEHVPIDTTGTDTSTSAATSTLFKVFDDTINGRGMGIRALKPILEGDEIMREGAAMRVPGKIHASTREEADAAFSKSITTAFEKISLVTKKAVMELSSCEKYMDQNQNENNVEGVYQTNSFQLGDEVDGGLFLTVSRLNHSCRPNVNHIWRPDLQQTLIKATRDIKAGEELCTSYGPSECLDTTGRRSYLQNKYAFVCTCEMCLEGNTTGGDDRMIEINALCDDLSLFNVVGEGGESIAKSSNSSSSDVRSAIESVDRGLLLLQQQGLGGGAFVKSFLRSGYQISTNNTISTDTNSGKNNDSDNDNGNNSNSNMHFQDLARTYLTRELRAVENSEGLGSYRAIDIERTLTALG